MWESNVFTGVCLSIGRLPLERGVCLWREGSAGGCGGGSAFRGRRVCLRREEAASRRWSACRGEVCNQFAQPRAHGILWDTVNKRAVCILLKCILVQSLSHISTDFNLMTKMTRFDNNFILENKKFINCVYFYLRKLYYCENLKRLYFSQEIGKIMIFSNKDQFLQKHYQPLLNYSFFG